MVRQTSEIYQDLSNYSDIHYIYAAVESTRAFFKRPFLDIVEEIHNALREVKNKFVFLATEEALLPLSIDKIHRLLAVIPELNETQCYYLTSSIDGERAYDNYCKRMNYTGRKITILPAHAFERKTQRSLRDINANTNVEPNTVKEKLFLCFNKVNREHRLWLVDRMLQENLVEKGYYSFEGEPNNWINLVKLDEFPNILKNKHLFPMRLNITEHRTNPVDIIHDDINYHKNSYFSIVTETLYFDNDYPAMWHKANVEDSIFFTEKTYRCFALKHPFILLGRPNSLNELRKSGYRTFYPFIDEKYDTIVDNRERFEFIISEIKRLCNMSQDEWASWVQGIKEIVDYNHMHFFNRKTYDAKKLVNN